MVLSKSIYLAPDDVFVVSAIDESMHFSIIRVAKQDASFDPFAKKDFASFRQKLFAFSVAFDIQIFAFKKNSSRLAGCHLVGAAEIDKFFRVDPANGGIFIVTHCLTGNDLPDAIPL